MSRRTVLHRCLVGIAFFLAATDRPAAQQIRSVSPALPTSADIISIFVERPNCLYTVQSVSVQGANITLTLDKSPEGCPPIAPNAGPFQIAVFALSPLASGTYTVTLVTDGAKTDTRTIVVQAPTTQLSLLLERFTVAVTWTNPFSGAATAASAVQLADASGYFWFFSSADVDLTVKMVGADPTFWFFAASGTDEQFTITVTDTFLNRTTTYSNPSGVNRNIIDFFSFRGQ